MASVHRICSMRGHLYTFSFIRYIRGQFMSQSGGSHSETASQWKSFTSCVTGRSTLSLECGSVSQLRVSSIRRLASVPDLAVTVETEKKSQEANILFSSSQALVEENPQRSLYRDIVHEFPDGIQMAFAYGSGAIQQGNANDKSKNMLDFIFVVDKPRRWHRINLERHPHHYSFLKHFGPRTITRIQERYGAGAYFNTLVPMAGRTIKYGVISTARLVTDLLDWESLYISGRLHKPVSFVVIPSDENLLTALTVNLRSAVHAALLLLPDMFTEEQLYLTIAKLSYAGDFRMAVAEDNNKITNIVQPSLPLFRQMYSSFLLEDVHSTWWPQEGQLEQALTFESRHHHLKCLPTKVLYGLLMQKYQIGVFPDLEEIIKLHAYDSDCGSHVAQSIRHIVKRSSVSQSLKGILTAGVLKSLRYSSSKILKKVRSRR
ncbi:phosphatidate cytidylyltransferase, mitochondrial [Aplysia californica]|uniref:Phosphatidate cytidylyltransferase, mitochondrial n=1 Tax=Aplysia californica TaxID=6500 RepID=A0ABM0JJX5_APLCA|nr:phosphatidate cytidylyltransferase, mitochondrial [Aplysia californica]